MFKRRRSLHPDLSTRLRSELRLWNVNPQASRIDISTAVCTICVDVPAQLFAVGTSQGEIRVYNGQFKETVLITPKGNGVKQLQFARPPDSFKLLCIDRTYTLHVWNLDVHGSPVLQASQKLDGPIYRISTCSSHSHALVATQSGDVVTYNLATLKLSPYRISSALDHSHSYPATDVALLPLRLNHVLIGYSAGTILYDLLSREVIRSYTQTLNDKSSSVMGLALHPVGQHYAAGYDDGAIRIWSVNFSQPLWVGNVSHTFEGSDAHSDAREPIFKMEWILLENGDGTSTSWLIILGGLLHTRDAVDGISALGFDTACFHSTDMEISTIEQNSYLYRCTQPAQDFAVLPADSASTTSYSRLFIVSGSGDQAVSVAAFKFPLQLDHEKIVSQSRDDAVVELEFSAELEESEERSRDLAATLEDLRSESQGQESQGVPDYVPPAPVSPPLPLCGGNAAVLAADLIRLDRADYLRLVRQPYDDVAPSSKTTQYRIMITQHEDGSVRFHDVSVLPDVNLSLHPIPLEHLNIRVLEIPEIALRPDTYALRVAKVAIARASLDCVVQISTGEIVVHGLGLQLRTQDILDDEILDLSGVRDHGNIYIPRFILRAQKSNPVILCLSDIGFLAVAFQHGLLLVVDLRGPKVLLRDMQHAASKHEEGSVVESLYWVISGVGDDNTPAPRLLASRHDGSLAVFTLTRTNSAWAVDTSRTAQYPHYSLKEPLLSVVLDAQTGMDCFATPSRLADSMESTTEGTRANASHCFWIIVNRREMRVYLNITGEKVSKVVLSSHDTLDHVSFVNAHDSSVLVAFIRGRAVIYSLPALDAIHTFQLPLGPKPRHSIVCTAAGDILETFRSPRVVTSLMFTSLLAHSISSASGTVNFRHHKYAKTAPAEPSRSHVQNDITPIWGSNISNWIKGLVQETPVTGDEIDQILAGPRTGADITEVTKEPTPAASNRMDNKTKSSTSGVSLGSWGQGMYQQLTSAATERGERLGELQEHFQQLEAGSKDLVSQAKQLAEKQAAKRWFL